MYLYYAPGSGLGHFTRATAVLHTLKIPFSQVVLVTSTTIKPPKNSFDKSFNFSLSALKNPGFQNELKNIIKKYHITTVFADTFPFGLFGELKKIFGLGLNFFYVVRLLKWEKYLSDTFFTDKKIFEKALITEKIYAEHRSDLRKISKKTEFLPLSYPQTEAGNLSADTDFWLVVHSQPLSEVKILLDYALMVKNTRNFKGEIIVSTFAKTDKKIREFYGQKNVRFIKKYEIWNWYPKAEKIFTAAGFNSVKQTAPFRDKTNYLAFYRQYDDQFFRLKELRNESRFS